MEKDVVIHLNKIEFPSPTEDLCQIRIKLAKWFRRRRFLNDLPLEEGEAVPLNNYPLPQNALYQVWLKLARGSGEENL